MTKTRLPLSLLLVALVILAGCVAPSPPDVPDEADISLPDRGVGIMEAPACPVLDGSIGYEPGPYPEHGFPRLKASNGNYIMADASISNLNRFRYYDMVEMVSTRPFWYVNGCTTNDTFAYLRGENPTIKLFGVFHAYGFNNPTAFSWTCHPNIRQMWDAYDTANGTSGEWYMEDDLGALTTWPSPLENQVVLNWSDAQPDADHTSDSLSRWWADHVTGADFEDMGWDGVILEAAGIPHSYFGYAWDIDENGALDFTEVGKGRAFASAQQYEGWNYAWDRMAANNTSLAIMVDGGWQPNSTGFNDPSAMLAGVNIAQDFAFPTDVTYLNTCGGSTFSVCPAAPPNAAWWGFHMRQYIRWMDGAATTTDVSGASFVLAMTYYDILADTTYSGATKWGAYITSYDQYRRFVLGSTLLDNGYAQVHAGQYPTWCDECGVIGGSTSESLAAKWWMGCPLGLAVNESGQTLRNILSSDYQLLGNQAWTREYENALVVVNPTTSTRVVTIGTGWRRILGTYDAAHNNGAALGSTISVGAMDSYVLVRDGAPTLVPPPTATPTSTPTAGPSPTPTATPTAGPSPTPTTFPTSAALPICTAPAPSVPTIRAVDTPTPTPTASPTPTATATPTRTPTPTATPTP